MKRSHFLALAFSLTLILSFSAVAAAQADDKYLIRAKKSLDKKKYDDALAAYRKSFEMNPNWKAAYGIGSDFLRKENYAEAVVYFRRARELKEDEPLVWYSLGYSFGRLNDNEEAVKALRKAVELKPDYADAWYNLGSVLFKSAGYEEAVKAYQTTVKLNPKDAEAYAYLGAAYANLNDFGKAVESFQKAVKLAPNNAAYRQNLAAAEIKLKERKQQAPAQQTIKND